MALWAANYLLEYRFAVDLDTAVASDPILHLPEAQPRFAVDLDTAVASDPVLHLPEAQPRSLHSAWLPPSVGLIKINVDGALFTSKKKVGIGVV